MKTKINLPSQPRRQNRLGWRMLCLAALSLSSGALLAQTSIWNGGSSADSLWNDAANWGGTALTSGNAVTFGGTIRQTNTNNVSGLSLAQVTLSTNGWNISGSNVTLTAGILDSGTLSSGANTWAIGSAISATTMVTVSNDNLTISGVISGAAGLLKNGAGTLTLAGANTYTGSTIATNGTLNVTGNESTGGGSWLQPDNYAATTVNFKSGSAVMVGYGNTIQVGSSPAAGTPNNQTFISTGTVTNYGTMLVGRGGYANVIGGSWLQASNLSVLPPGGSGYGAQMVISNGVVFTYTGSNNVVVGSSASNGGDGISYLYGCTFVTDQGFTNPIPLNTSTGYGQVVMTNGATILLSANVPELGYGINTNQLANFSLGAGGGVFNTASYSTALTNLIGGIGSLTKAGSGTLSLGDTNTYTGKTVIAGGTLALIGNGSISTSPSITISNGAVFDVSALGTYNSGQAFYTTGGGGTVNGSVSLSNVGNVAPGGAGTVGTLTFNNNLTLNSSVVTLKLSSNPNSGNDLVNVDGQFINNGSTALALDPASGSTGTLGAGTYTLVTYGSLANSGSIVLAGNITNATLNIGSTAITLTVGTGGTTIQTIVVYPISITPTWTGASPGDSYWSDPTNWGGFLISTTGTVNVTFTGTARIVNTNNLAGVTFGTVNLATSDFTLVGNPVTLTGGTITADVAGTTTWGLATYLNATPSITQSSASDILNLTNSLSGPGGLTKTEGSTGQGEVILSDVTNSFSGPVNDYSGELVYDSLATQGNPCSLGTGSPTVNVGANGTSYAGTLAYAGTTSGVTDRGLNFSQLTTSTESFLNNSPNSSSIEWDGPITINPSGTAGDQWTTLFGGSSTGTNTFGGAINLYSYAGANLSFTGPGTWLFENLIGITNNITVSTNSHVFLSFNGSYPQSQVPGVGTITMLPGATLDVSTYDLNGYNFTLGSYGYPQTLVVGRTNGAATDINGSLSLNGYALATLSVAGVGTAGTLTITTNLVLGSGTVNMDLGTNTSIGGGVNDLILVGGNLDLSQGSAFIAVNALKGSIVTNQPYTLISYTGQLIGNASGLSVASPGREYLPGVVSTAIPNLIQVTFYPSGVTNADLIWLGNQGQNWDVQTTPNWLNAGSSDFFYNGDSVIFNDQGVQTAVNIASGVLPGPILVTGNTNNYVFSTTSGGFIYGSEELVKQGATELTLDTANTFSGGVDVSAGAVSAGNATGFGSGTVTMGDANTGTNTTTVLLNSGVVVANPVLVTTNALAAQFGYELGSACTMNGLITLLTNLTISCSNADNYAGYELLMQGGISGNGNVTITGGGTVKWQSSGSLTNPFAFNGNLYLTPGANGAVTYLGVNAAVSTNTSLTLAANTILGEVSNPTFNALNGGGLIEPGIGATYDANFTFGNGNGSGTFSGSFTTNAGGYYCYATKNGTGTEIFTGDNSPSAGSTTVNAGTMVVNNPSGYGLPTGGFNVAAGATLTGNGVIFAGSGNNFFDYGTLSVGSPGHTSGALFTLTNTAGLTIESGGAVNLNLFSGAGAGNNTGNAAAADVLAALCPVTINSTNTILTVGNPNSLTAWAAGDAWKIVTWKSAPTTTFSTLDLPILPPSLAWSTSSLYSAGVIGIVANTPAQPAKITGVTLSGNNMIITGTNLNGGQSFQYELLTSTNLALPLTNWMALTTNSFNVNGTFNYTNPVNPAMPAVYFEVEVVP